MSAVGIGVANSAPFWSGRSVHRGDPCPMRSHLSRLVNVLISFMRSSEADDLTKPEFFFI
jgi:hypothetical protein